MSSDEYLIGKNKPPVHTRFKKGKSGNPKGRPKRMRTTKTDNAELLDAPVKAKIGGKRVKMSAYEASQRLNAKKAIEGDLRSIKLFLDACEKYELTNIPKADPGGGVVTAPPGRDLHEWMEEVTEWVPADEMTKDKE